MLIKQDGSTLSRLFLPKLEAAECGGLIYTDVRGEGAKEQLCAAARQPKQGCA